MIFKSNDLLFAGILIIGILVGATARSMDPSSAEILSTNDAEYYGTNILQRLQRLTFTTEAYRKEALKRVIQEANWAARQLQSEEALPVLETNLLGAYITPYGGTRRLHAIGNVTTSNYSYGVGRDYKLSDVVATHVDEDRSKYAKQYSWPVSRTDTNTAYQLATQWLTAVSIDVRGLNNDCTLRVYPLRLKGHETNASIMPVYWVSWTKEGLDQGSVAYVELFLPTKKLMQLCVTDPKYILRPPIVFTNLVELLVRTNAPPTTNPP